MKQTILEIQRRFELALEAKTGWGRVEIKSMYQQIVIEVLSDEIDYKDESFQERQAAQYQAEIALDQARSTIEHDSDDLPY